MQGAITATTETLGGSCHCGAIRYVLHWPGSATSIEARACGCSFCRKHAGTWCSHPEARLEIHAASRDSTVRYRFGTGSADFCLCSRCGVAPFVLSEIGARTYAVVNVNTLANLSAISIRQTKTDFAGEDTDSRLERRQRNWIPDVSIC
jgi:hypothetical protein